MSSTKKKLLSTILVLLPLLSFLNLGGYRDQFLTIFELTTEIAMTVAILIRLKQHRNTLNAEPINGVGLFAAACGFLIAADTIYNLRAVFKVATYDFIKYFGEANYSLAMCAFLASFWRTRQRSESPNGDHVDYVERTLIICALIVFAGLNIVFILIPFEHRIPPLPLPSRILNPTYSALTVGLTALLTPLTLRCIHGPRFILAQVFLFLIAADFAIRYQSAFGGTISLGWAEPGWAIALSTIATLIIINPLPELFGRKATSPAPWSSIRVLFALAIGLANLLMLSCILLINLFTVKNAVSLSTILLILYVFWFISNWASLKLSQELTGVSRVMLDPTLVQVGMAPNTKVEFKKIQQRTALSELDSFFCRYNELVSRANSLTKAAVAFEKDAAQGKLANQVAHDIRSPLAALDMISSELDGFSEERRVLVRGAVGRIRDIANNLLEKSKQGTQVSSTQEALSVELLPALLSKLISEKRVQHRSRHGIEIDFEINTEAYGLFASIQPIEFGRMISNLINNAVEALGDHGKVLLTLCSIGKDQIELCVQDNGKGIPIDVLPRLMARGESHSKKDGNGLGLYHAKIITEGCGATIDLTSTEGEGTQVRLIFPRVHAPGWFVRRVEIETDSTVVVLDDDPSIHRIWDERLETLKFRRVKVLHFASAREIEIWTREAPTESQSALYLVDFELIGDLTGIEVIERLDLADRSILVTSRFEEKAVRDACQRLRVRLIPKGMAGFVPISLRKTSLNEHYDTPDVENVFIG